MIAGLTLPMAASAADTELLAKLEALSREIEILRAQIKESEEKLDNLATISEPPKFRSSPAKSGAFSVVEFNGVNDLA